MYNSSKVAISLFELSLTGTRTGLVAAFITSVFFPRRATPEGKTKDANNVLLLQGRVRLHDPDVFAPFSYEESPGVTKFILEGPQRGSGGDADSKKKHAPS